MSLPNGDIAAGTERTLAQQTEPSRPISTAEAENAGKNTSSPAPGTTDPAAPRKPARPKAKRPNYAFIHRNPLPLEVHPLPAFHPTNPFSLLRIAYAYLSLLISPPESHPTSPYIGYSSLETRSVHVTDSKHVRALWEMGFFGKGTLSRSEPSWVEREKARLKAKRVGGGTAEEATNARREKRRAFKLERARAEAEKIERQRKVEQGLLPLEALTLDEPTEVVGDLEPLIARSDDSQVTVRPATRAARSASVSSSEDEEQEIENQEHLQLTCEEAFFLSYGLGVLDIRPLSDSSRPPFSTSELLRQFDQTSTFPRKPATLDVPPDSQFMLNYVVYHHFRSLGWVVRPGIKFSIDYLLYYRGPVFSHAEFAVMIIPSYSDAYWNTEAGKSRRRIKEDSKDWWWLHCVNRVQSQVLKTLVLVYVDIPPPNEFTGAETLDVGALLKGYKLREFVMKRWVANRSRD
ncbi:tRNA-splicing endonuclease subunit Sen2 like protein [Zymoseptoria brevis]|uniref:tRNA-splicing endonuclease subunit Sen2 n=1 Tax=Zymoseptoria brevis TaxID=1047168 RepID=A0A0F4G4R7_9PEZI|nr:tRNA-splicing endonuclease subunit Sen2 like protein [Zymoseptoria brevis]